MHRTTFARFAGLLLAACLCGGALAFPPDAEDRVRAFRPADKIEPLPAATWTVVEEIQQPDGHTRPATPAKQVAMGGGLRMGGEVLLVEASGGRCLIGAEESPSHFKASREFRSFDDYVAANSYAPLPTPPGGLKIRQLTTLPSMPLRITSDGSGKWLYVLSTDGNVFRVELPGGQTTNVIPTASYGGHGGTLGITLDRDRRLYIVENAFNLDVVPQMNHVTVYRAEPVPADGSAPSGLKPWFQTDIPFAIDVFQHGVSYIGQGPDGYIYVSSGSRTDHGEKGDDPKRSKEGETPISSAMWRLDSKSDRPKLEIFAKGLRNAFGFCFDDKGRLFATENGPNADAPEEVNIVEHGKHYGFPYQFSDWSHKAYPDQPDAPPGLKIEPPLMNLDPHSSPSGIVQVSDNNWPAELRGTFLVARFGNLIGPRDVGFDVIQLKLDESGSAAVPHATTQPFLAPVARPTDLHMAGGKLYICEYSRQTRNNGAEQPGRILEVSPAP